MTPDRPVAQIGRVLSKHRSDPDYVMAGRIIDKMLALGWAPPTVVGAMVSAAGGKIEITTKDLQEDHTLFTYRDHSTLGLVIEAP